MEWKSTAVSLPLLIELNFLNVFLQCRLMLLAFHENIASKRSELHLNVQYELEKPKYYCLVYPGLVIVYYPLVNLGQDRW